MFLAGTDTAWLADAAAGARYPGREPGQYRR